MKSTVRRLGSSITEMAGMISDLASGMPDDSGIRGAEAVIHLRNAHNELNHSKDCMQIVLAQAGDEKMNRGSKPPG